VAGRWISAAAAPVAAGLSPIGGGLLAFAMTFACMSVVTGHALSRALIAVLRLAGRGCAAAWRWMHGAVGTAIQEHREARVQRDSEFDRHGLEEAAEEEAEKRSELISRGKMSIPLFTPLGQLPDEPRFGDGEPTDPGVAEAPPDILTIGEDGRVRGAKAKPEIDPIELVPQPPPPPADAFNPEPEPVVEAATTTEPEIVQARLSMPPKRKRGGAFTLQRTGEGF